MDIKFTVSELSKIVGLSARNLRYYDEIGLFKCSGTLENGYRYYTIDKIEEIYIINYLRHMGISIKNIRHHLENRNIDEYGTILNKQLDHVTDEIAKLQHIKHRIERRISSIDYIRNLPPLGEINIQSLPSLKIIRLDKNIESQLDWEVELKHVESKNDLIPSVFIGDIGFFVDMKKARTRGPEEFSGIFLLADDSDFIKPSEVSTLDEEKWLTVYVRGDHKDARKHYDRLLDYAEEKGLNLKDYAVERTLIDHYISSDPNLHITEILIPIVSSDNID